MGTPATFSEHDSEPVRGLPEPLPPGETLLWQGSPRWWSLALDAYRVRALAVYFGVIVLARGAWLRRPRRRWRAAPDLLRSR